MRPKQRMIENATGIILRTRPLTETSLIVNWLTPALGRITTVAKGARRSNSPFRGKLDLFYLADFSFARSRRSELHTLREVALKDSRKKIRQDLALLQQASYASNLIEQATEVETPIPILFELMSGFLAALTTSTSTRPALVFAFELKVLNELGLSPDVEKSKLSPGATEVLKALRANEFEFVSRVKLSAAQNNELQRFLHGFLIFHLGKIPGSRSTALRGS
jgi:DNA repair protein RecO (recombination protein O)